MAFLDDISKKITDVTSSAAQKTKDLTEISKLNSAISEEENKLNNAFLQIGRLYCANHAEDYEDCFGVFVNAAKECEKKIADMNAHIRDIRGIISCPTCGEFVSFNVAFCSNCGTPTPKATPAENANTIICPGCGVGVPKGMRFCTSCGFRMPEVSQVPVQPAPVQPAPVQPAPVQPAPAQEVYNEQTVSDMDVADATRFVMAQQNAPAINESAPVQPAQKVCPSCGKILADGMVFCTECGTRL